MTDNVIQFPQTYDRDIEVAAAEVAVEADAYKARTGQTILAFLWEAAAAEAIDGNTGFPAPFIAPLFMELYREVAPEFEGDEPDRRAYVMERQELWLPMMRLAVKRWMHAALETNQD